MPTQIPPPPHIGEIVRRTRKERGLTLEKLAERCGVSKSMLSQIERGHVNPTFAVVWNLTQALAIDLSLVGQQAEQAGLITHTHAYSTPVRTSEDGLCTLRMLNPMRTILPMEWYDVHMGEKGVIASDGYAFGTYEHITCLEGRIRVEVGGNAVNAAAGDTLRYHADRPHCIRNLAAGPSRALLVTALPAQYATKAL